MYSPCSFVEAAILSASLVLNPLAPNATDCSQASANGPAEYFTGAVRIDSLFQAPDPARVVGASVTFEPAARTAWHTPRSAKCSS